MTAPLPEAQRRRWTFRRKAEMLDAIKAGHINEADFMSKYEVSPDEMAEMWRKYRKWGERGLRAEQISRPLRRSHRRYVRVNSMES